ncbi:hypothetical protein FQA39_LY12868 [Lamprigera yunnana]|nr:hypothetical protein FQA39_LY12868 [Lamprigera yunnana]
MVTKGSVEEILDACTKVFYKNKIIELTEENRRQIIAYYETVNKQGKRLLGVATKKVKDEQEHTPKPSAAKMIQLLKKYGVDLKILTGDNEPVTRAICKMVDLDIKGLLTGDQIEIMSDYDLKKAVEECNIFC